MDDAFDTIKNQRVRAVSASGSHFPDRYICPVCQTEVVYVSSDYVTPHFRHRPGTDHEECERYCRDFHVEVPLSHHEWEHLDAVLVAQASSVQGQPCISLAVRFRPAYAVNSVSFVSGRASTLYTIHHTVRQQFFRISEAEETYVLKTHLSDGGCERHIVEGFGETPAVFRANSQDAVRLPTHRVLRPGGYLVVSKSPLQHQFHVSLAAKSLRTIAGLHATSIEIPEDPSWQVRSNLQSLLGFQTASAMATYAFLEPIAVSELATDCWEVANNERVVVLIRLSRHLSPKPGQILAQQRRSGHLSQEYLSLNEVPDLFVISTQLGHEPPDVYRIGLGDPPRFLLEIRRSTEPVEPECGRLVFHFYDRSKERYNLSWSSHELSTAFIDVSRGLADLVSITKPKSVEISVSDRSGRRAVIPDVGAAGQLTNFLREAHFPCTLFATGYPDLRLWRERVKRRLLAPERTTNIVARSRREARLLEALTRGRVSPYVLRSLVK
jgi:hypothetical protein